MVTLHDHTSEVTAVDYSASGRIVASAGGDGDIFLWDAIEGRKTRQLRGHEGIVTSVKISADNRRLVSASYDGTIRIWDVSSGEELLTLTEPAPPVLSIAIGPEEQIASLSSLSIRIWDSRPAPVVLAELRGEFD